MLVHHLGAFPRAREWRLRAFCLSSTFCFIRGLRLSWSKWPRPEETSILFCCVSSLFQIISCVPKVSPLVFARASHLPSASVFSPLFSEASKKKKKARLSLFNSFDFLRSGSQVRFRLGTYWTPPPLSFKGCTTLIKFYIQPYKTHLFSMLPIQLCRQTLLFFLVWKNPVFIESDQLKNICKSLLFRDFCPLSFVIKAARNSLLLCANWSALGSAKAMNAKCITRKENVSLSRYY